uniref:Uncharacterized protein n=1 Tax=Panthera tigris altaica TaxID=74533 RepID=A0A8C9JTM8_PANTA
PCHTERSHTGRRPASPWEGPDTRQRGHPALSTPRSVAILMFDSSQQSLVLVKQFRIQLLVAVQQLKATCGPGPCGPLTGQLALSARPKEGWREQDRCVREARAVSTRRSGVGLTGSSQTMFYAEVTDSQRSGPGGGLAEEGELIQVVHLPLDGAQAFADDPDVPKTLGVIFGISWFLSCVAPGLGPR